MTEIEDLQARLRTALERIGQGIDGLDSPRREPEVDQDEVTALREALASERDAVAQLEERLKTQSERLERLERETRMTEDALKQDVQEAEVQAAKLRRTNTQLRQSIHALREAAEVGVTEPHLINQAMISELEGLRVAREGDRAEMDAILGALKPMLEEKPPLEEEQNA